MGCINNLSERVKSVSAASEKVYAVEMQGISKYFGSFCALNGVQLSVEKGSIHALLGENGAGKSTLMNVLYGLYQADEGEIRINGQKAVIKNPNTAIKLGIGMVHQHFMLVEAMTVLRTSSWGTGTPRASSSTRRPGRRKSWSWRSAMVWTWSWTGPSRRLPWAPSSGWKS